MFISGALRKAETLPVWFRNFCFTMLIICFVAMSFVKESYASVSQAGTMSCSTSACHPVNETIDLGAGTPTITVSVQNVTKGGSPTLYATGTYVSGATNIFSGSTLNVDAGDVLEID